MPTPEWTYRGQPFTEAPEDYIGFVYVVTNRETSMRYLGKKLFWSVRKLKPLKGQKRKRTVRVESDWKTYCGSSETVKALVEEKGLELFDREILHLCKSKGELSYMELREQLDRDVLLRPDYYNGIVNARINRLHVKNMVYKAKRVVYDDREERGDENDHHSRNVGEAP